MTPPAAGDRQDRAAASHDRQDGSAVGRPSGGWLRRGRRLLARISFRLLAFNVLLVFLPAAGLLYLGTYEEQLLAAQERSMVQQGRILAAALARRGALDAEVAQAVLVELEQQQTARLRVLDREGRLLADSSRLGPRRETPVSDDPRSDLYAQPDPSTRGRLQETALYRLGAAAFRLYRRLFTPPGAGPESAADFYSPSEPFAGQEVRSALGGSYGAATRVSPGQRSVTLYSALPVEVDGEVVGAVLVSQSTLRLLADLYQVRLAIFRVFLASVAAAVVLSLLVSTTIARPLRRLRREAQGLLDRRGRLRGRFGGSKRLDEIGDLARSLAELSRRLEEHLAFAASFAADVSHQFKNPLATIRTATELLSEVEEPEQRRRFLAMVEGEVARLERLLSEVRDVTLLDAGKEDEERQPVALGELLAGLVERFRLRPGIGAGDAPAGEAPAGEEGRTIELRRLGGAVPVPAVSVSAVPVPAVIVPAVPDQLERVFENLLDNALSFAPPGSAVTVTLAVADGAAVVTVDDRGPGVPPEHREAIFRRFFTYRPLAAQGRDGQHSGLGLAIVRAIVESHGGSVAVGDPPVAEHGPGDGSSDLGARFTVRLPLGGGEHGGGERGGGEGR